MRDAGLPHAPAEPRVEPHIERVQRRREALSPRLLQEGEVVFARRADTARDEEHAAGGGRQAERARAVNVQQVRLELAEFVRLVQDVIAKQHADSTMDFFFSEKLKGAFQYVDVNRSGTIDVKELQRALDVMGVHVDLAQAKGVMARYDVDRNSSLDLAEFARLVADIIAWKQRESLEKEVSPEKIRAAFKLFDHNNDNFIDVRELKPALDRLQPAFEKTGASAKTKAAQLLDSYFGDDAEDPAIAPVAGADSFAFSGGLAPGNGGGVMLS